MNQDKFLVKFFNSFSHQQVFFVIWFGVAGLTIYFLYRQYTKITQRNFRAGSALNDQKKSNLPVKKDSSSP